MPSLASNALKVWGIELVKVMNPHTTIIFGLAHYIPFSRSIFLFLTVPLPKESWSKTIQSMQDIGIQPIRICVESFIWSKENIHIKILRIGILQKSYEISTIKRDPEVSNPINYINNFHRKNSQRKCSSNFLLHLSLIIRHFGRLI